MRVCVLNSPRTSPFETSPFIFGTDRKHLFLQYNPSLGYWAVLEEHEIQAMIHDQIAATRAIADHKGACNFNKVKFGIFDQMNLRNFGWQTRKSPRQNNFALNNGCYVPGFSQAVVAPWDDMVFKRINCSYLPVSERKQGFRHYMESTFGKSVVTFDGTRENTGYQLLRSKSITAIAEKSRYIPGYYDDFMSEVFDVANGIYDFGFTAQPIPPSMGTV